MPQRVLLPYKVVFGHWSAMGFYENNQVVSLDTGCVWGGKLTMVNVDNWQKTSCDCRVDERSANPLAKNDTH